MENNQTYEDLMREQENHRLVNLSLTKGELKKMRKEMIEEGYPLWESIPGNDYPQPGFNRHRLLL